MISAKERERKRRQIIIVDRTICYHCKTPGMLSNDVYCPNCGFPQGLSESEQWKFIINYRKQKSAIKDAESMVKKGRNFLFIVAGFNLLAFIEEDSIILIIGLLISSMYVLLALWSNKKPFPALLTGLIFYVTMNLFFGLFDPAYIMSGLIWKIAIIGALLYALYSVKYMEKLRQEIRK